MPYKIILFYSLVCAICCLASTAETTAEPFRLDSNEFPIVMMSVDNSVAMKAVQGSGVDYVHSYTTRGDSDDAIKKQIRYLDLAQEYGFRVMFNLNTRQWLKQSDGIERMIRVVNAVKDHPAMGFWYLIDEPSCEPTQLLRFYEALKKLTPDIPIAVAMAWTANWREYGDTYDFIMPDFYPVRHEPFPLAQLQHVTNFADQAIGLGKPVMFIHQSINWGNFYAGRGMKEYGGRSLDEFRLPNNTELRYMCYSALAQGQRGLGWWSCSWENQKSDNYAWISGPFAEQIRTLRQFTDTIEPACKPERLLRAGDSNCYLSLWRRPTGTYLVLVNAWPDQRPLDNWLEGKVENARLVPVNDTRKTDTAIRKGKLVNLNAEPWETFIWKVVEREEEAK